MRKHLLIWSVAAVCALLLTACCCCCCGNGASGGRRNCPPKKECRSRKVCPQRNSCPAGTVESVTIEEVGMIPVAGCGCQNPASDCCQNAKAACCVANRCPCLQLKKPVQPAAPVHGPVKTAPATAAPGAANGK